MGSVLTLSVLLSHSRDVKGGEFLTCGRQHREHVQHSVSRGDGILFHSEKMHNVAPLTKGIRHSLVIELWPGQTNTHDRHS